MKQIRLLLIEDNRLLREGIATLLMKERDIRVIAASPNGGNTVRKMRELKPNVILLDLGLRSRNSLRMVETVKKNLPKTKVIVMDLAPVQSDIVRFVKAGASAYILKDAILEELLTTIRMVAEGRAMVAPGLTESLLSRSVDRALTGGEQELKKAGRMTARERVVIRHLSNGLTYKEIAQRLRVTIHTVKSHVGNIMEKLVLHTHLDVTGSSSTEKIPKTISRNISAIHKRKGIS
ncbi:MAG: response regulator transcription factor [Bacteroidota bacterium]